MCGIVGFIGKEQAAPILLEGLSRLEYRGYDSAGLAVYDREKGLQVVKAKGRLQVLYDLTDGGALVPGVMGVGHTRWATHGAPNDVNSHPQVSQSGRIAVVHNGIIENYAKLKEFLESKGVVFASETDTEVVAQLRLLPSKAEEILAHTQEIQYYASIYFNHDSVFFIGRNIDYAVGLEGSLKLKEISYIHSEAYAAGELKHGTISLIEDGTLVVALASWNTLFDKLMSNVKEVKARGADVIGISTASHREQLDALVDSAMTIPDIHPMFLPSLEVIPMQLFAYYVALMRGCDIDKPRNLAKSVTVE